MSNYKDHIISGTINQNSNNKPKEKSEAEIIIDDYIEMLKKMPVLENRKDTFKHFDEIDGLYKKVLYEKLYKIYMQYINKLDKHDQMQVALLNNIDRTYITYTNDKIKKEKEKECQENGHIWEEKWSKTNNGWQKQCLRCKKKRTTVIDPYKIIEKPEEKKGIQRRRKK